MPFKIPGVAGTFYEPGERKGNSYILWRGRDDTGVKLEISTDARDPKGAQAYVRLHLAERARRRPPPAATEDVDLATVDMHYRAERGLADDPKHPDNARHDFIVARDGKASVRGINSAMVKAAAEEWLAGAQAKAARGIADGVKPRPRMPTRATANRNVITPYRALLHYAHAQKWCEYARVGALKEPRGTLPAPPPIIADDATVLALLEALEAAIVASAATPWTQGKHLLKRAFVWLCHERGYRISEWMRFDWAWIDLPAGRARMAITKNKDDLRWEEFELSPAAVAMLAALGPRDEGRIFPWHSRSYVYKWADSFLKPLGKKWRPHESRRAIVSHIVAMTGDYKQAGRYVGHASEKTTFRYRILRAPDLAPAVRFTPRKVQAG